MNLASGRHPFEYAVLRVMPRIERGEAMNAGVILYCRAQDYLGALVHLDIERLYALDPGADVDSIQAVLSSSARTCGDDGTRAGEQEIGPRFRWLTAPRSTVVQPGPVHTGLTADPRAELAQLLARLVLRLS
jgi:hypothetical protein